MNKQRLVELAGISEAQHHNYKLPYIIIGYGGNGDPIAFGPFNSKEHAEAYLEDNIGLNVEDMWVDQLRKPDGKLL